jgi:hypothetical protein
MTGERVLDAERVERRLDADGHAQPEAPDLGGVALVAADVDPVERRRHGVRDVRGRDSREAAAPRTARISGSWLA